MFFFLQQQELILKSDTQKRTQKVILFNANQWLNGRLESVNFNMRNAMFYPNAYINFNNNGYYTKHYYNGMERIASRLGDQHLQIHTHDPELQDRKDQLDTNIRRNIVEITGYNFLSDGEEPDPDNPKPHYDLPHIGVAGLQPSADGLYYYHTNHLGSTSFVTDENASVVQGFLYAPFGEITNEYNNSFGSSVLPKYSFNAKELDEETGMYYYEARYYAPPIFTSRDPHFERYPTFSPYTYCANNPVKFIDPDGRDWYDEATKNYVKELRKGITDRMGSSGTTSEQYMELKNALSELNELEISNQKYRIKWGGLSFRYSGEIQYNLDDNCVDVIFYGQYEDYKIAHELKHAYQFEVGELSFNAETGRAGFLYDLWDEMEAHQRGDAFFDKPENPSFEILKNRYREFTDKESKIGMSNFTQLPKDEQTYFCTPGVGEQIYRHKYGYQKERVTYKGVIPISQ